MRSPRASAQRDCYSRSASPNLTSSCSANAGCEPLGSCRKGAVVTVSGRLKSVVYTPRETVPTLEAELFDGSGSVTLVWLGRRRIAGIEPGRSLTARGRFAAFDGKRVIYNPWYELGAG